MRLTVIGGVPPNMVDIELALGEMPEDTLYCWDKKLYNPSRGEISPDIEAHEAVHSRQQAGKPKEWWSRYLTDQQFRLEQELEAYTQQYLFVKSSLGAYIGHECLYDVAEDLAAPMYALDLTIHQARTLISHKARSMLE